MAFLIIYKNIPLSIEFSKDSGFFIKKLIYNIRFKIFTLISLYSSVQYKSKQK